MTAMRTEIVLGPSMWAFLAVMAAVGLWKAYQWFINEIDNETTDTDEGNKP